ncbi:uncharacterized protein UDID_19073 [Ustilago sp. UG-2017a]|nr:uncharacterized protein UDID_19073 [Ustilago sp. UG-2017a]
MAVAQSPWRPWTPTDSHAKEEWSSHAKEERAHMRGGPATKRTKLKGQACKGGAVLACKGGACHGPECSGSRRAPVESMAVVQSPWRPWTPMDSHAKEERAHMRGGPAKKRTKLKEQAQPRRGQRAGTATKRTKLKEHADGYHSGAREIRAKGTITGRRRRSSV